MTAEEFKELEKKEAETNVELAKAKAEKDAAEINLSNELIKLYKQEAKRITLYNLLYELWLCFVETLVDVLKIIKKYARDIFMMSYLVFSYYYQELSLAMLVLVLVGLLLSLVLHITES